MKRLIKYHNIYNSDKYEFSNCSTKYEVLPLVIDDTVDPAKVLREYAKANNINTLKHVLVTDKPDWGYRNQTITHALPIGTVKSTGWNSTGEHTQYLGFITFEATKLLPTSVQPNQPVPKGTAYELVNMGFGDIQNTAEIDGTYYAVLESWAAYHALPLLGYTFESFLEDLKATETVFSDSVSSCGGCGTWMHNDDGYTHNFRIVDECELLGIECGCFEEYGLNNVDLYADKADRCIEAGIADKLVESGRLVFVERFIGGMTDGRGGSYAGESTCEGHPKSILKELKSINPNKQYVFSHDESGQFQTYFSVYELIPVKKSKSKSKRRKAG